MLSHSPTAPWVTLGVRQGSTNKVGYDVRVVIGLGLRMRFRIIVGHNARYKTRIGMRREFRMGFGSGVGQEDGTEARMEAWSEIGYNKLTNNKIYY
jgi:hypothetical protein